MKLQSMIDFVLEQRNKIETDNIRRFWACEKYAKFLKQPLGLWMFVSFDEGGNVLEEPIETIGGVEMYIKRYQQAKERCLFEGFEVVTENFIHNKKHYFIKKDRLKVLWNFNDEWNFYPKLKTIEDLIKYDLQLTQTAIKKLGL